MPALQPSSSSQLKISKHRSDLEIELRSVQFRRTSEGRDCIPEENIIQEATKHVAPNLLSPNMHCSNSTKKTIYCFHSFPGALKTEQLQIIAKLASAWDKTQRKK
jgi:hypothetical protein